MRMTSMDSEISKFSGTMSLVIPKLGIPIKSFLIKEKREMVGVIPQEMMRLETKGSYNFRKIRLVLVHEYIDETLITENYTYNEFSININRDFEIY